MASVASGAVSGDERRSYPNIEIHTNARAGYTVPALDASRNIIIHLKGFASYLEFNKHIETRNLGDFLVAFVAEKLTKDFLTVTIVWDGDTYNQNSFTALIPRLCKAVLPRKTFLVAFVQRCDKYNTKDSFLKSWGGTGMPITLYLTQNFGGYESNDPFALLGQFALNCTGSECVVSFGGGNCVKQEYELGSRVAVQWYVFPASRYHKKKGYWESASLAIHYYSMSNIHLQTLESKTKQGKAGRTERTLPTTVRVTNIILLRKDRFLQNEDLWFHLYEFSDRKGRKSEVIDAQGHFWKASKEGLDFAADIVIDGHGCICCPGFVDLQLNGAFGVDFTNMDLTAGGVNKVCEGILAHGVTSFLPTVITSPSATYHTVLPVLRSVKKDQEGEEYGNHPKGARILGVHLEGPFINREKKGAHDANFIQRSADNLVEVYGSDNMAEVKLVTIAPEIPGALAAIQKLTDSGIVASIGHTMSSLEDGIRACERGARKITHLFNAMNAFHHRDPGIVGLLGLQSQNRINYGIIPDGFHAHPSSVKIAYDAHPSGAILVTDAMCAMGLNIGNHKLGTKEVTISESTTLEGRKGKKAFVTASPGTLAGSVVSMIEGVINFKAFTKCKIEEALYAASFSPAETIHADKRKGHLNFGADADFLLLDPNVYSVVSTFVDGRKVYEAEETDKLQVVCNN